MVNIGAFHEYRPGRPSLACDLVETLRAPIVDRWVLSRNPLHPADFDEVPTGGMHLRREVFSKVRTMWEDGWVTGRHCVR